MFHCGAKVRNKDQKCKRIVKEKGDRCYRHNNNKKFKTFEKTGTLYSDKNNQLLNIYSKKLRKDSFLKKSLTEMQSVHGNHMTMLESIQEDIVLARSLVLESVRELHEISSDEDPKKIGKREWLRGQIIINLERIAGMIEKEHKIKYGTRHIIRIESVQKVFLMFQDILVRKINDPTLLMEIVKDMEKTLILEPGK